MNEEVKKEAQNILAILRDSAKYTRAGDYNSVFLEIETLISSLAYLIGPLMDLEQKYREQVVDFSNRVGYSAAKAENEARAGDDYKQWKKLQMVYDLAHEQIMASKKFADKLSDENRR